MEIHTPKHPMAGMKYAYRIHSINNASHHIKLVLNGLPFISLPLIYYTMERSFTHCEIIPNRIILKNNNYAYRKTIINKKFEWLNKYLSAASPKIINPARLPTSVPKIAPKGHLDRDSENSDSLRVSSDIEEPSGVLQVRDSNYSELRKTSSSQIHSNKKSSTPNNNLYRFFRSKKIKSQFSKCKSIT